MALPSPKDVLNDPEFFKLPVDARRKVLMRIDRDKFGKLSEQDQIKVVSREPKVVPFDDQAVKDIPENLKQTLKRASSTAKTLDIPDEAGYELNKTFDKPDGMLSAAGRFIKNEVLAIPRVWGTIGKNMVAGVGMLNERVGGLIERFVSEDFGRNFKEEGARLKEAFLVRPDNPEEFKWSDLLDADWYTTRLVPEVPTMLALIPAALVGRSAGLSLATKYGLGTFARTVLGSLGATATSRPIESAFEAQESYETAIAEGKSKEEADKIADKVFRNNLALAGLDALEFITAFSPVKFRPTSLAMRAAATGAKTIGSAGMEGLEERFQDFIQKKAVDPNLSYASLLDLSDTQANEATVIGAIFGLGLGGAGSVYTALTAHVEAEVAKSGNEAVKTDFESDKAESGTDTALNNLAQKPEGKKIITEAVKKLVEPEIGGTEQIEAEPSEAEVSEEITKTEITQSVDQIIKDITAEGAGTHVGAVVPSIAEEVATPKVRGKLFSAFVKGRSKVEKMVKESTALREVMKKSEQAARVAYRAGKLDGVEIEAQKMKRYLGRAKRLKAIRDEFKLTDRDLQRVSRSNPLLMTNYEWKQYLDDVRQKAGELAERKIAISELRDLRNRKQFKKEENFRKAMKLPPISEMDTNQLRKYAELLEPFQEGDIFLTQRELETIDNTDLSGAKTEREVLEKLTKETGVHPDAISKTTSGFTKNLWDTQLRQKDPFLKLLVDGVNREILDGDASYIKFRDKLESVGKPARKAWKVVQSKVEAFKDLSFDQFVINYLESDVDGKKMVWGDMPESPEAGKVSDYINTIEDYFSDSYDYLVKNQDLTESRFEGEYYPHMRRPFWEALRESGLGTALKELRDKFNQDREVFQILEGKMGKILPMQKFFSNTIMRTGVIEPSKNTAKVVLEYARRFERKRALDRIIPKFTTYAQVLTPKEGMITRRGLEMNTTLKDFVREYINTKKGRVVDVWVFKQGNTVDMILRSLRTFTTIFDLGLNIPVQIGSFAGESVANYIQMGEKAFAKGVVRQVTPKGIKIASKYEEFIGESPWRDFTGIEKTWMDSAQKAMFGLFDISTRTANKTFLLGSMTDAEWEAGEISKERLAELRGEMGRFRHVPGGKSIFGATSLGAAMNQYRTWARPIQAQLLRDIGEATGLIKGGNKVRAYKELGRLIGTGLVLYVVASHVLAGILDKRKDERTFVEEMLVRAYQDGLSLIAAFDYSAIVPNPRILSFLSDFYRNIQHIVTLEETRDGELKGVKGLGEQFKPKVLKQLNTEN